MSFYSLANKLIKESIDLTGASPTQFYDVPDDFELTDYEEEYIDKISEILYSEFKANEDSLRDFLSKGAINLLSASQWNKASKSRRVQLIFDNIIKRKFMVFREFVKNYYSRPDIVMCLEFAVNKCLSNFYMWYSTNHEDLYIILNSSEFSPKPLEIVLFDIDKLKKRLKTCFTAWLGTLLSVNDPKNKKIKLHVFVNSGFAKYAEKRVSMQMHMPKDVYKDVSSLMDNL